MRKIIYILITLLLVCGLVSVFFQDNKVTNETAITCGLSNERAMSNANLIAENVNGFILKVDDIGQPLELIRPYCYIIGEKISNHSHDVKVGQVIIINDPPKSHAFFFERVTRENLLTIKGLDSEVIYGRYVGQVNWNGK